MPPLRLTDSQLDAIMRAAEPLHPHDRAVFLLRVAALLEGAEIGDGLVGRAARQAQAEFRRPIADEPLPRPTRWARQR